MKKTLFLSMTVVATALEISLSYANHSPNNGNNMMTIFATNNKQTITQPQKQLLTPLPDSPQKPATIQAIAFKKFRALPLEKRATAYGEALRIRALNIYSPYTDLAVIAATKRLINRPLNKHEAFALDVIKADKALSNGPRAKNKSKIPGHHKNSARIH